MIEDFRARLGGFKLSRLDGRPRRIAALSCLVLAGVSALTGGGHAKSFTAARPEPGQIAVAITLADGGAGRGFLHSGQHIDLLSDTSDITLRDVAVLSVAQGGSSAGVLQSSPGKSDGTNLVVGVSAKDVAKLTALTTRRTFAAPHDQP